MVTACYAFSVSNWTILVSGLCVIGIIYASLIAIQQDDLKKLVAYSSIAHIGLMCLAVFAVNKTGIQGVMLQMFNHGINIIGLWIVVELIKAFTPDPELKPGSNVPSAWRRARLLLTVPL